MQVGVVFPQTEIGSDPGAIREYAQAAEELGYAHLVAYDHVLGADTEERQPWPGPYTYKHQFHEPFALFAYLAGVTKRIAFAPAVVILPQRQTALVAKQAAEVDVLSGGRFRMGVGLGWNYVEYEALRENFRNKARRIEEQIQVLRLLWTQELVTFKGRWHTIDRAGLNPMPVQRPIPLWMGGNADPAVRRIAKLADGWFTHLQPNEQGQGRLARFRQYLHEAGRDPAAFPIEGRVNAFEGGPDRWAQDAAGFKAMGISHLEFNTMRKGFTTVAEHIAAIRTFRETAPVFGTAAPPARDAAAR